MPRETKTTCPSCGHILTAVAIGPHPLAGVWAVANLLDRHYNETHALVGVVRAADPEPVDW